MRVQGDIVRPVVVQVWLTRLGAGQGKRGKVGGQKETVGSYYDKSQREGVEGPEYPSTQRRLSLPGQGGLAT